MTIFSYAKENKLEISKIIQTVEINTNEFLDTIKIINNMRNNKF